jgi:hypothetical protein
MNGTNQHDLISQPSAIIFNNGNCEVLRINAEGHMICGEGLSTEQATQEAAKMLIEAYYEHINKMVHARIAAMKEASK